MIRRLKGLKSRLHLTLHFGEGKAEGVTSDVYKPVNVADVKVEA